MEFENQLIRFGGPTLYGGSHGVVFLGKNMIDGTYDLQYIDESMAFHIFLSFREFLEAGITCLFFSLREFKSWVDPL